ncbi:MAG: hypothetical protein R3F49_20190 [Planctomycetota bacterium]
MSRNGSKLVLALCLLAALSFGLASGALTSGFGAYEDEPAHVTTALMLRDWIATRAPLHPVRFAEDYYLHYPKVAIGQWPPVLHIAVALWTLAFGVSQAALLALPWLLAALTAWLTARLVVRELDPDAGARATGLQPRAAPPATLWWSGAVAGIVLLALPLVQEFMSLIMTELPMAFVGTLGALAFGRWLEAPSVKRAVAFALVAVLAILTKGSGLALALVPPFALLLARRPGLALRPSLWVVPVLVGLICAPWYALSLPIVRASWSEGSSPSLEYALRALTYYPPEVVRLGGPAFIALAAVGLLVSLRPRRPQAVSAALAAWLGGLALLHASIPSSLEARHLVVAAPALTVFACLGAHAVVRRAVAWGLVRFADPRWAALGASALLVLPFGALRFTQVKKDWHGFDEAAALVCANADLQGDTVLVASGAAGEGLLVLGFALHEAPRRDRQVLRASKVLASASWIGDGYETRFESAAGVREWLASVPVAAVLLDASTPERHRRAHLVQLRDALEGAPETWTLAQRVDVVRAGQRFPEALEVWLAPGHAARAPQLLGLDEVLGRAPRGD